MAPPLKPLPRIDVYSVRLFIALAQEGSIARAAQREHIAASALSRRLADLEHALGTPLVIRSARGVELTDAGRHLFERGQHVEQELLRLGQEVRDLGGRVSGRVRLHANPSSIVGFLPERLRRFCDLYPDVNVELAEQRSREVIRACLDGTADVGVAVATDVTPGLQTWPLVTDPLVVLLPADHALASRKAMRFLDVLRHGLVGVHLGGAMDQAMREAAHGHGLPFQTRISVESFDAACRMVQAGLGLAILPTSAASAFAGTSGFVLRQLQEPWAHRELWIYALQKHPRPRAVDALIDQLHT